MNKILITGVSGFAGSFLATHLLASPENKITGTYLSGKRLSSLDDIATKIDLVKVDLMNQQEVEKLIVDNQPDVIYHLAALASPHESFKDPTLTFDTNITGQIHLLESLRKNNLVNTKVLIVSSAEVYGIVKEEDLPIDEDTAFNPTSPYAVSKIAQDYLGLQYNLAYGINILRVRPFNHIGPRQTPQYVVSSFAKQIVEIEKGQKEPVLYVGNLNAKRDLTDVRDIVRAYSEVVLKGKTGSVYNIGSGKSVLISEVLDKLISIAKVDIRIEVDESLLKPIDIPDNRCDRDRLTRDTGWEPRVPLETSLRDVLDYWRNIT